MEIPVSIFFLSFILTISQCAHVEPILKQYQETGDQGQYQYGYQSGVEQKSETRTPDGRTQGSYSYLDSNGEVQVIQYTAGADGFHVMATNLPLAASNGEQPTPKLISQPLVEVGGGIVGDTPEVAAAKMQHAAAHVAALRLVPRSSPQPALIHRSFPVVATNRFEQSGVLDDTPEVLAARMQHAAAHAAALRMIPVSQEHIYRNEQAIPVIDNFVQQGISLDTPEVAFAKMQHATAHAHALRKFPVEQPSLYTRSIGAPVSGQPFGHPQTLRRSQEGPVFAEEVPRSALGETPEVAAAREAHLAEFAKVRAGLPEEYSGNGGFH